MEVDAINRRIQVAFGKGRGQQFASQDLFLYDDATLHKSILANCNVAEPALKISNPVKWTILHFCIDGELIPFEQDVYSVKGFKFKHRCDSMLFTDRFLILVELKMNIESNSSDESRWSQYAHAMKQISEFLDYLTKKVPLLTKIYMENKRVIPYIGIANAPKFDRIRNTQRHTQKEAFREKTGLKIKHGSHLDLICL